MAALMVNASHVALWLEFSTVSDYFLCDLCGWMEFAALNEASVHKVVK